MNLKFQHVNLGQTVLKYKVPYDVFMTINTIYEREYKNLPSANKILMRIKARTGLSPIIVEL